MRNATIQTHRECADKIREILLDKTVAPELVDTMTRAANILRKSKQNFDFGELCRGLLASPQRIRLL